MRPGMLRNKKSRPRRQRSIRMSGAPHPELTSRLRPHRFGFLALAALGALAVGAAALAVGLRPKRPAA